MASCNALSSTDVGSFNDGNSKRKTPASSGVVRIETKNQPKALRPRWLAALPITSDKMKYTMRTNSMAASPIGE
jgi:hypothetical protein